MNYRYMKHTIHARYISFKMENMIGFTNDGTAYTHDRIRITHDMI